MRCGLQMPLEQQVELLQTTRTLYVGNLSFYTTEEQIYELFSRAGEVARIVMGLNRLNMTPCGFCFVECYSRADALACVRYLTGTVLDERVIRVALDRGFEEGRQYGRGRTGRQNRDDHRDYYDPDRGGWGREGAPPDLPLRGADDRKRRRPDEAPEYERPYARRR